MVVRVSTVAFEGVDARPVDVQVQLSNGSVVFNVFGLGDKAVAESRERVRSALVASGLSLPAKRITVNLAPADMPKEGSHYDLPIALGVMAAIGAIPFDALDGYTVLGELALDGTISPVAGVLPAAVAAGARSGPDLSRRLRTRGRLGVGRPQDFGAAFADPFGQSFQGIAGDFASRARYPGRRRDPAGSPRNQGPGERQTRARNCCGRRPQPSKLPTIRLPDGVAPVPNYCSPNC